MKTLYLSKRKKNSHLEPSRTLTQHFVIFVFNNHLLGIGSQIKLKQMLSLPKDFFLSGFLEKKNHKKTN